MDERRDPKREMERFNKAQENLDFETMWDVLYHTACQYCKKHKHPSWTSDDISDIASDISFKILNRYYKDAQYRCKHMAAVHYAFLGVVYDTRQKEERFWKACDSLNNYYSI